MELSGDLSPDALARIVPGRAFRAYPAMLSTESEAAAWARAGAPEGAFVVAGYQASPRGRAGISWQVDHHHDLAFSLILRPELPALREGWMYTVSTSGLADSLGEEGRIEWPDEVYVGDRRAGAVGVQMGIAGHEQWAVVTIHLLGAPQPRGPRLRQVVESVEARYRSPDGQVLRDYLRRCRTIGRRVDARLMVAGPTGATVEGEAVGSLPDGGLVLLTDSGSRMVLRPQHLGFIERRGDPAYP
jgi:BirA family biotin operon repressor/biotin-[acetyl-CoA-carboxylase] ligase